jgi:diguanylate cyclase (GGDEF)-like protein
VLELLTIDDGRPSPPRSFDQPRITIGRSASNDLVLSATYVSARHGQIRHPAVGEAIYEDLRARNGTFVRRGGALIAVHERADRRVELLDGDELVFGEPGTSTSIQVRLTLHGSDRSLPGTTDTGEVMVLTKLDVTDPARMRELSASMDREALLALQDYSDQVARRRSRREILTAFCDAVLRLFTKASHVSIYLADTKDSGFSPAVRLSRTLRDTVSEKRQAVSFTIEDPGFDLADSLKSVSVRVGICAPLWTGDRMAGLVQVDGRNRQQRPFDDHDLEIVAVFANQLAVAVDNIALHEQLEETVTDLRGTQKELERLAFTDSLTGLSNRRLLQDRLDQTIKLAMRQGRQALLVIIDLDRFKRVNDTYGHNSGDEVLALVGARLQSSLRAQDTVARIGGDEFAAIVFDVSGQAGAAVVADKLLAAIRRPTVVAGQPITMTASLGLTLTPGDGDDVSKLLLNADQAMYRAKKLGRNRFNFFTEEMNRQASRRLVLETELREALDGEQFRMHFQPIVRVSDVRVVGLEALVRWQHPRDGLTMPDEFIEVAEQSGIIVPLGEWILRSGCRQARMLMDQGVDPVRVAVNLSARQFTESDLPVLIENVLEDTGLDSHLLQLEITESMLMEDTDPSFARLERLKRLGVSLCVDDFGIGYSSLGYLKRLPVDSLKIDRTFTDGIPEDQSDVEITAAVIAMAHKLNLKVVAEGVHTGAQLEFLRANDCDEAQGHLFGKAGPIETLELSPAIRR